MFELVEVSFLEKSIQSLFLIGIILLVRKYFNIKSIKWANKILWTILFMYLLIPYSILINIETLNKHGIYEIYLKPIIVINEYAKLFALEFGYLLSKLNRILIAALVVLYTLFQIYKMHKSLIGSTYARKDKRIDDCIRLFNFKRKITVLVNDNIKVPITYGVLNPKIILQSYILKDNELLKYVLIHELTHISRFDIIFTHIKNLIVCFYWYNIFIVLASRYMEDDIEILCDKLVIQKVGDTIGNRKEYCLSMLKMIEENENTKMFVLKLHPSKERMIIMRKWEKSLAGVMSFVLIMILSTTVFADVKRTEVNSIVSSEEPSIRNTIHSNQVQVITDKEYASLKLEEIELLQELRVADFDENENLDGLSNKKYEFDMSSWTEPNHNVFAIKLSDMSCNSRIDYEIIIQQNENVIYREYFNKATNITVKAHNNSKYKVIIDNRSVDSLKYKIKISSYIDEF